MGKEQFKFQMYRNLQKKIPAIYAEFQKYIVKHSLGGENSTILIAPSWGAENILESCGERLVELLLDKGYKVIVRPHPETVRRSPKLIDNMAKKFDDNPNFTLEWSIATFESLLRSDVLICDYSGVALEYAFGTERPVLFLDVPYKVQNQEFRELDMEPIELSIRSKIGVVVSSKKLDAVPKVIQELKANRIQYRERVVKLREENIYAFGHSSVIGAKYIIDLTS